MSALATSWAWSQQGITPEEKIVLLALAEGANHQGQCWPLKSMLEGMCSMPTEKLFACLKRLAEVGLLATEERAGAPPIRVLQLGHLIGPRQVVVRERSPQEITQTMAAMMDEAVTFWNDMSARTKLGPKEHWLAAIRSVNAAAKVKLAARLKEFGMDGWKTGVMNVENSAHCRGVNDQKWRADFAYLLQPKGSMKAMNGLWPNDYEERTNGGQRVGPAGRGDQRLDNLRGFDRAVRDRLSGRSGHEGGGPGGGEEAQAAGGGEGKAEPHLALGGPDLSD